MRRDAPWDPSTDIVVKFDRMAGLDSPSSRALFRLWVYQGLRITESVELKWADVDLNRRLMRIPRKGDKLRILPVHPVVGQTLSVLPRGAAESIVTEADASRCGSW